MTTRSQSRPIACALTILVAALAGSQDVTRAQDNPQLTRPQAAMVTDLGNLSDKFVGLARVMAGKYDWRPGPGVRSVADVLNLIVMENRMLAGLSADDLNASVKLFGRDTTKQGAAFIMLMDQHEHLGQSIAYARTNAIVPPWSK